MVFGALVLMALVGGTAYETGLLKALAGKIAVVLPKSNITSVLH